MKRKAARHSAEAAPRLGVGSNLVEGRVAMVDDKGVPWVGMLGQSGSVRCRIATALRGRLGDLASWPGRSVLLLVDERSPRPVIVDVIDDEIGPTPKSSDELDVTVDGRRVVFNAKEEIVFRAGKASITLTRAGKVLIRGEYVSSEAAGVHRVAGGSVRIN